jgi:hypothetical protein
MSDPQLGDSSGAIRRRSFLTAAGIAVAGAATLPLFGPRTAAAHDPTCACLTSWSGIWSVAKAGGKYLALAGKIDTGTLEIRLLDVDARGKVGIGSRYPVTMPAGFTPSTFHGFGDRLLLGGSMQAEAGRIAVDYTVDPKVLASPYFIGYNPEHASGVVEVPLPTRRPALVEIVGEKTQELPLGAAVAGLGWGNVGAIATPSATGLAVLISGSAGYEFAYGDQAVVAESSDAGRSWTGTAVASGLGESWPGTLTATGDALLAVTVNQDGRRTFHQRTAQAQPWTPVDAGGDGRVLGTVAGRGGAVVFDENGDHIRRRPYSTQKHSWTDAANPAQAGDRQVHALLTIGGAPTEWIAVTDADARLVHEA